LSVEKVAGYPTGTALIVVAGGDNSIVVVPGANFALTPESVELSTIAPGDLCVAQFEVPVQTIVAFFKHAKSRGAKTILNPAPAKGIADDLRGLIDIIILNETELASLTGLNVDPADSESLKTAARALRGASTVNIIVTIGAGGAVAYFDGQVYQSKGHTVVAVDSTGAGDCFVGAFASALADSSSLRDALEFANAAAAISVTRKGAGPSMPTRDEVKAFTDK
jgi:ribokinase